MAAMKSENLSVAKQEPKVWQKSKKTSKIARRFVPKSGSLPVVKTTIKKPVLRVVKKARSLPVAKKTARTQGSKVAQKFKNAVATKITTRRYGQKSRILPVVKKIIKKQDTKAVQKSKNAVVTKKTIRRCVPKSRSLPVVKNTIKKPVLRVVKKARSLPVAKKTGRTQGSKVAKNSKKAVSTKKTTRNYGQKSRSLPVAKKTCISRKFAQKATSMEIMKSDEKRAICARKSTCIAAKKAKICAGTIQCERPAQEIQQLLSTVEVATPPVIMPRKSILKTPSDSRQTVSNACDIAHMLTAEKVRRTYISQGVFRDAMRSATELPKQMATNTFPKQRDRIVAERQQWSSNRIRRGSRSTDEFWSSPKASARAALREQRPSIIMYAQSQLNRVN